MCSLLQEHLTEAGEGTFTHGRAVDIESDSPIRTQVWVRRCDFLPNLSTVFDLAKLQGRKDLAVSTPALCYDLLLTASRLELAPLDPTSPPI